MCNAKEDELAAIFIPLQVPQPGERDLVMESCKRVVQTQEEGSWREHFWSEEGFNVIYGEASSSDERGVVASPRSSDAVQDLRRRTVGAGARENSSIVCNFARNYYESVERRLLAEGLQQAD